jgi:hypothetical protein
MDREILERRLIKAALREIGLSDRQVDGLLRDGWKALVGATHAEADELREAVALLKERFKEQ